jgi:hypothetical protein
MCGYRKRLADCHDAMPLGDFGLPCRSACNAVNAGIKSSAVACARLSSKRRSFSDDGPEELIELTGVSVPRQQRSA